MGLLFFYLILKVNKWAHVKLFRKGHAVVELDSVHSGVVKVKTFQLQRQQVGKVQKAQTLKNQTQTIRMHYRDRGGEKQQSALICSAPGHLACVAFLLAALAEVLVGPIQSFRLNEGLQCFLLLHASEYKDIIYT